MRVVIDTNVLMSGLFWPKGPPRTVLEHWGDGKFTVVVSPDILTEYRDVAKRIGKGQRNVDVTQHLNRLLMMAEFVFAPRLRGPICTDPDDDKFIAAAVSGKAKYIVTGDKALLNVKTFRKVFICSPARFLALS